MQSASWSSYASIALRLIALAFRLISSSIVVILCPQAIIIYSPTQCHYPVPRTDISKTISLNITTGTPSLTQPEISSNPLLPPRSSVSRAHHVTPASTDLLVFRLNTLNGTMHPDPRTY